MHYVGVIDGNGTGKATVVQLVPSVTNVNTWGNIPFKNNKVF